MVSLDRQCYHQNQVHTHKNIPSPMSIHSMIRFPSPNVNTPEGFFRNQGYILKRPESEDVVVTRFFYHLGGLTAEAEEDM